MLSTVGIAVEGQVVVVAVMVVVMMRARIMRERAVHHVLGGGLRVGRRRSPHVEHRRRRSDQRRPGQVVARVVQMMEDTVVGAITSMVQYGHGAIIGVTARAPALARQLHRGGREIAHAHAGNEGVRRGHGSGLGPRVKGISRPWHLRGGVISSKQPTEETSRVCLNRTGLGLRGKGPV